MRRAPFARRRLARDLMVSPAMRIPSREQLLHDLYEAAELEHDLMCTYLYAAFTIKTEPADGITSEQAERATGWRRTVMRVAVEEMSHLTAVWNITSALGGAPRFGRGNFPIDPGALPSSIIARLAPFDEEVLQHFLFLERPLSSHEGDGAEFPHAQPRHRAANVSLTPMPIDYDTVGAFYATLGDELRAFVDHHGEAAAFCNDPALQLSTEDVHLPGIAPVVCSKTALAAFTLIVEQGEGAPSDHPASHFAAFGRLHAELVDARRADRAYAPALPAARDPVLRPPISADRVWITNDEAAATVDLANASYGLMLRLLAYAYQVPRGAPERRLAVSLGLGLMHAMAPVAERAARLPAGPAHPGVNAGMTFTALRDAAPLPPGAGAWRFFGERLDELAEAATTLARSNDARSDRARRMLVDLAERARRGTPASTAVPAPPPAKAEPAPTPAPPSTPLVTRSKRTQGRSLAVLYDGQRCIHARFCVTGAPQVFHANVTKGPWIFPDEGDPDRIVEIIHQCPSGALHYDRADGKPEPAPAVNLIAIRENGPYAIRADVQLAGARAGYRMTLCRCGASANKPFCDKSHIALGFAATGEPTTTSADPLPDRAGPLAIEPQLDGPLELVGNVEITSGTGRIVARVTQARLCRCGASATKPFCDNSHQRIGFRSDR
jgi:CDGSH-type Zn-finger protein/uncharacterized Fe-S cluster protein YjdI